MRYWDSNPQPSVHESPLITTIPGLLHFSACYCGRFKPFIMINDFLTREIVIGNVLDLRCSLIFYVSKEPFIDSFVTRVLEFDEHLNANYK